MTEMMIDPTFQLYLLTIVALVMNLVALGTATAITRTKAGEVMNPEDRVLQSDARVTLDADNPLTARIRRAHRNAIETIPVFMLTGAMLPLIGTGPIWAGVLFGLFVLGRVVHSVAYIRSVQPLRTIAFTLAEGAQVALLVTLVWGVASSGSFSAEELELVSAVTFP